MTANAKPNSIGIRKASMAILGEVLNMISLMTNTLQMDAIDVHVLICTAYHSAMLGDLSKYELDFENDVPDHATFSHGIVPTETIHLALGMPRETVRKRLLYLEVRGFIKKAKKGYVWIHQYGDDDKSIMFREYIVSMIKRTWDRSAIAQEYMMKNKNIEDKCKKIKLS